MKADEDLQRKTLNIQADLEFLNIQEAEVAPVEHKTGIDDPMLNIKLGLRRPNHNQTSDH